MQNTNNTNFVASYEAALKHLQAFPEDHNAQHRAVLALARAGSLDFAVSEYKRYGLHKVRHHEDIMALGGRLSKDLYISASGQTALQHAQESAALYEAAFQDTQGYYSGINAATMACLANMPSEIVQGRAKAILDLLPQPENLTQEDHYFIEATRAECFLLLGDTFKSQASLRQAIEFDPLNYVAHATTLKQFRLILRKQKSPLDWLNSFAPPRPVHFAGHIWRDSAPDFMPDHETLARLISDTIQKNDIGYGYGALAAGADIVTAEILLEEGAELHVILPTDQQSFLEQSVRPFGAHWVPRFKACINQATTIRTLDPNPSHAPESMQQLAGQVAMGQAILKGQHFDVSAKQLLVHNQTQIKSLTFRHASEWRDAALEQIIIPISGNQTTNSSQENRPTPQDVPVVLKRSNSDETQTFPSVHAALKAAFSQLSETKNITLALHYALSEASTLLKVMSEKHLPNTLLVSEPIASSMALMHDKATSMSYAGTITTKPGQIDHFYTVTPLA